MKKSIFSLVAFLLFGLMSLNAQSRMKVHLTDGTVSIFSIANIDHIDWDDETATYEDITINGTTYHLGVSGAIDLGLSVKWAAFNVGATAPSDYGDYYAWGETETKTNYDWSNYLDSPNRDANSFTKYAIGKQTQLDSEDDVAHVKWGGDWRMPTKAEVDELLQNCTCVLTSYGSHNGYVVIGSTGNAIFLPAAGFRNGDYLWFDGDFGCFWSSSFGDSFDSSGAYTLGFDSSGVGCYGSNSRMQGQSVRPVCP